MSSEIPISLKAEPLFHIGSYTVNNSLLLAWVVIAVLAIAGFTYQKKWKLIPGKVQVVLEAVLEGVLELMESVLGNKVLAEKYLPFVATVFIFVMLSNWFGLLPLAALGVYIQEHGETLFVPLFRGPAADLNFTLALAILSVLATNVIGIATIGFAKHVGKFFTLKDPISAFVGILEFVSEFAKMISFSFRLFGNVFAGEVLLIIVGFLVPYIVPLPFLFLEVFVGFIQAFIFAMLTTVFIAAATHDHDESEGHHAIDARATIH